MSADWTTVPLGSLVTVKGGKRLPKEDSLQVDATPHPYIRVRDMGQRFLPEAGLEYVPIDVFPKIKRYIVEENDVLISIVGTIGLISVVNKRFHLASQTENSAKLTGLGRIDALFLYYYLVSSTGQNHIKQATVGAVQAKLPLYNIEKIPVVWPERAEREKTVEQLCPLDDKIELNHQINQTLEQIAQTIFKSWFADFEPVKAKVEAKAAGRDPERAAMCAISGKLEAELDQLPPEQYQQLAATAALFPDELVESDLGLVPVGWEVRKVESLLTRLSSKVRYTKDQVKPYGITPVFEQGSAILLGYHDGTAQFTATPVEPAFIFGDHTCVTHLACEPFDISQNVIPLKGSGRSTIWVYYAVKDKQVFQEYRRHWMELIVKDVVVPTEVVCQAFADIATSFHLTLEANTLQSRELVAVRDTLLPKLLSGELSIETLPLEATA